jgi:hypothetical protein
VRRGCVVAIGVAWPGALLAFAQSDTLASLFRGSEVDGSVTTAESQRVEATPRSRLDTALTQVYSVPTMLLGAIIVLAVLLLLVVLAVWASRTSPNDESTSARDSVGASGKPDEPSWPNP